MDAIKNMIYKDKNYSITCIKWIAEMGYNCSGFSAYMNENDEVFKDMLCTLRTNKSSIQYMGP